AVHRLVERLAVGRGLADGEDRDRLAAGDRAGDVVADHAALRGVGDLGQRERTGHRLRGAPRTAGVGRGDEPDVEPAGGRGAVGHRGEVVVQADPGRGGRGRPADADTRDEVVDAAVGGVDRYPGDRGPGGPV